MEKVSVIIPAYNAERSIADALQSVLQQDGMFELEIIVIDDGSTDSTSKIVESYISAGNNNIKLIKQKNKGVATARNVGIRNASGEYLAFLDSDDFWCVNKLELQIDFLKKMEYSLVGGGYQGRFLSTDEFINVSFKKELLKQYFQPSTVVFKKHVLEKVNGFTDGRRYCEDALFFYHACYHYKCAVLTVDLIKYGDDKHPFASGTGLGSDLWKMEQGELINYKELFNRKMITLLQLVFLTCFSFLKYMRRVVTKKTYIMRNSKLWK